MEFSGWTFAFQIANFLVLVFLLRRFLWRPVLKVIEKRQSGIEAEREEAARRRREADEALQRVELERAALAEERERVAEEARVRAAADCERMVELARSEAEATLARARATIARERGESVDAVRREAAEVAVDLAGKLLSMVSVEDLDAAFLEPALEALRRERRDLGRTVTVSTARPVPEPGAWRERIAAALERPVEVTFEVDPSLIAGVDLRLQHTTLRHSWRHALSVAREELSSDDAAAAIA